MKRLMCESILNKMDESFVQNSQKSIQNNLLINELNSSVKNEIECLLKTKQSLTEEIPALDDRLKDLDSQK